MQAVAPAQSSLYVGASIHLPGLLLNAKGDRVAMNSSVETRYPFLDEEVFEFLAGLHPKLEDAGHARQVHLASALANAGCRNPSPGGAKRCSGPRSIVSTRRTRRAFVDQLLSPESLAKTGYLQYPGDRGIARQNFRS